jgi:hypothetical protein
VIRALTREEDTPRESLATEATEITEEERGTTNCN